MALKTTSKSTMGAAVNVAARIERELLEAEIWLKRGDLVKVKEKLKFVIKALVVFVNDEKEDLLESDKIAIQVLRDQVIELLDKLSTKKTGDLLTELSSLKRLAKKVFG